MHAGWRTAIVFSQVSVKAESITDIAMTSSEFRKCLFSFIGAPMLSLSDIARMITESTTGNANYMKLKEYGARRISLIGDSDCYEIIMPNRKLLLLPDEIGGLCQTETAIFTQNCLYQLPRSFADMTLLVRLELDRNNFDHIPEVLTELPYLHELFMGFNPIEVIPDYISRFRKLKLLDLYKCRVGSISAELANLTTLCSLHLDYNRISNIDTLCTLTNLALLGISCNPILEIPDTIHNLTRLRSLRIDSRFSDKLPTGITEIRHLDTDPFESEY